MTAPPIDVPTLRMQLSALHAAATSLSQQVAVLLATLPPDQPAPPREPEFQFAGEST